MNQPRAVWRAGYHACYGTIGIAPNALGPATRDHGSSPDHGRGERVGKAQGLSEDSRRLAVGLVPLVHVVERPVRRGLVRVRVRVRVRVKVRVRSGASRPCAG